MQARKLSNASLLLSTFAPAIMILLMVAQACGQAPVPPRKSNTGESLDQNSTEERTRSTQQKNAEHHATQRTSEESEFQNNDELESNDTLYMHEELKKELEKNHASELESPAFKIENLRVGIEEKSIASVPVVSFFALEHADFYQLARCDADASLSGPFGSLADIELATVHIEDEIQKLVRSKFWGIMTANKKCKVVSEALTRTVYSDLENVSGGHFYLLRACAFKPSKDSLPATSSCSELVTMSPTVPRFTNANQQLSDFVSANVFELEKKIEARSIELAEKARQFALAVVTCEKEKSAQVLSRARKTLLTSVIGLGARIGSELLLNDFSSPIEAAESLWGKKSTLIAEAKPAINVLRDIFTTENAQVYSCQLSEKIAREAHILLNEIEGSQKQINSFSSNFAKKGSEE